MSSKKHLVWFRNDLRVHDNTALQSACHDKNAEVYGLFFICQQQWQQHCWGDNKINFMLDCLSALQKALSALNIQLVVKHSSTFHQSQQDLKAFIQQENITTLYCNGEYGVNEISRDNAIKDYCGDNNIGYYRFHDQGILPPGFKTYQGTPFKIFTPYKKQWLERFQTSPIKPCATVIKRAKKPEPIKSDTFHFAKSESFLGGEHEALKRLDNFASNALHNYQSVRDIPAEPGTSVLSPWLASGTLSARTALQKAIEQNQGQIAGNNAEIETWINELIWRDFYLHILYSFPKVSKSQPFKDETNKIQWRDSEKDFNAWCEGQTGIPLVDAAMKQLVQTGWMHNRLRMVTAMFLTKHLLIDWRKGEAFFMQHLYDGHLAANNGGWQWAASTGTDAAPYFRVFNPVRQSERFDPEGKFIKQFLPELKALDKKQIHLPSEKVRQALCPNYPKPIVDLKQARLRAIEAFKQN